MAARIEPILTIADIDAMPEDGNRYEIIEGELFVSRAPSLKHQRVFRKLLVAIATYLDLNPIGEIVPGPGVVFSDFSGVIPDIAYVGNERLKEIARGERLTGAPDLIVEILSPGAENERRDKHAKRQLYRKYGVTEYWVVDPAKLTVEVYRTSKLKLVATLHAEDELVTALLPGFRCPVRSILE